LVCSTLRAGTIQNLSLALGVVLLLLAGTDLVIRRLTPDYPVHKIHSGHKDAAGFNIARPQPTAYHVRGRQVSNGDPVYSVTYTLDINGHRLTPGGGPGADTYLFFGDSFTYGEGINDGETQPAQFSAAMNHRFTVANLAFHGLGPQHMLRLLEAGDVDRIVTGKVRRAYYGIIVDHLSRVLGRRVFLLPGPRYVLGGAGRPVYVGRFIDSIWGRFGMWAENTGGLPSRTRGMLMTLLYPASYRLDLTLAILTQSAKLLADKYGTDLVVLVWDREDEARDLHTAIRRSGIHTIPVSSLIGDVGAPEHQVKHGVDRHPSARANFGSPERSPRWNSTLRHRRGSHPRRCRRPDTLARPRANRLLPVPASLFRRR
jgi:hypothetical protein